VKIDIVKDMKFSEPLIDIFKCNHSDISPKA